MLHVHQPLRDKNAQNDVGIAEETFLDISMMSFRQRESIINGYSQGFNKTNCPDHSPLFQKEIPKEFSLNKISLK